MIQEWSLWRRLLECPSCKGRRDRPIESKRERMYYERSRLKYGLMICGITAISSLPATAQLQPDDTLGNERSRVSPDIEVRGGFINQIGGGARRGENLFHSFRDFNVEDGRGVYFTNPRGVTNILTRVTGRDPSDIHGTLGVLGDANLFLLNPNGVLFGPNARLDLQGSFFTSTADSILFDNDFAFSATDPQAPPLLRISASIGLQYGRNPGPILVQGAGLSVRTGETLALLGGDISIRGGALGSSGEPNLLALGGRVELGSVGRNGRVSLAPVNTGLLFNHGSFRQFLDVAIADSALVDVAADGDGTITINARNISISGDSSLEAGIVADSRFAASQAGDITFNAAGNIQIVGGSRVRNDVQAEGIGDAGDITITAHSVAVDNGAQIGSYTFGRGNTGDIAIEADGELSLAGSGGEYGYSFIGTLIGDKTSDVARGSTGDVRVTADSITFDDGAVMGVYIYGTGNAGDVHLLVDGTLSFAGARADGEPSSIGNQVLPEASGSSGDIRITASSASLNDGAALATTIGGDGNAGGIILNINDTLSLSGLRSDGGSSTIQSIGGPETVGNAGNVIIRAGSIILENGASISSGSLGAANPGDLTLRVHDTLSLSGTDGEGQGSNLSSGSSEGKEDAGSITITAHSITFNDGASLSSFSSGEGNAGDVSLRVVDTLSLVGRDATIDRLSSIIESRGTNNGGDIRVRADTLLLDDSAQLASDNSGEGVAGSIEVQARSIILMGNAVLSAETTSGQGGNIALQNVDLLLLRNRSQISTTAGNQELGGDGGNITFNGNLIVAVPDENSDISANAFTGQGGNVQINAQSVFGIQSRPQPTLLSDITASSDRGVDGVVSINTPDVDPNQGLVQLPVDLVDASQLITQPCATGGSAANQSNEFVVTGRGGLPPTPDEAATQDAVQVDLVSVATEDGSSSQQDSEQASLVSSPIAHIVEAASWQVSDDGHVVLAAAAQDGTPSSLNRPIYCH